MQWLRPKSGNGISEIDSVAKCTELMKRDLVIFFKHSPTCPVSWMAHREVTRFLAGQPGAPLYLISVRQRRDVAQFIAEATGVAHESPQAIVVRRGRAVGSVAHDDVTAEFLQELCGPPEAAAESETGPVQLEPAWEGEQP